MTSQTVQRRNSECRPSAGADKCGDRASGDYASAHLRGRLEQPETARQVDEDEPKSRPIAAPREENESPDSSRQTAVIPQRKHKVHRRHRVKS
jgi:hypothetical protein